MLVGGALFDTAEKFSELLKKRFKRSPEEIGSRVATKGLCLSRLTNIVYDSSTKLWHSAVLEGVFKKDDIDIIVK